MLRFHSPAPATPKHCEPHRGPRDHDRHDDHCKRRKPKHCKPHHHHKPKKKHCR
jgi:hypothetical protein